MLRSLALGACFPALAPAVPRAADRGPPWAPPKPDPTKCWYEYGGTKPCWDGDNQTSTSLTFGTGLSGGTFAPWEKTLFAHKITAGHTGVMNHFWSTCNTECEGALTVRYYVDGEVNASIAFEPGMAAGTGFDDPAGSTTKHHGDAPVEAPAWGVSAASKQSLPCL